MQARSPPLAARSLPHTAPLPPYGSPLAALSSGRPSRAAPCPGQRTSLVLARHPVLPAMAFLSVLTFDHEGRPIQFDTWLDDFQLYLLSDSRDIVSLFHHTSRASLAPPATADNATRSQWLTRDAAARLGVRNHLPFAAMYALSVSVEGDCYLYVPPDPGIEAAALGASEVALPGTTPAEALHTFTLNSGASRCFFHDNTTSLHLF
ncbi:unnamed protein product [Closterium sp. NIES-54]